MSLAAVGLTDDEVRVVDYDPSWPAAFDALAEPLRRRLRGARIEHMGSTSVPGLAAKPLIDISVGLPPAGSLPVAVVDECRLKFRAVNPESVLFAIFGQPEVRLANVHVRYMDSASERWDLLFRDYLRAHPEVARQYGDVKRGVAEAIGGTDRSRYSDTKSPFIRSIVDDIEAWVTTSGWQLATQP